MLQPASTITRKLNKAKRISSKVQSSYMLANKRKPIFVKIKAFQRIVKQMQKRQHVPVKPLKTNGEKRKKIL